ncbi:LysR family transcriptional regulator [Clostridium sp. UBA6640]|uniref:LysR family transcriptional regulator n=1 Tax=Clostridium sp. UBA6640 TaxID=1946370 RepID=UPI0025BF555A|nr:LysR family transcriptional regulator [Clostridium sp. UBA6640]
MIDIKLETFITVANTKNFTRAANILNMTQPAISHHIKLLEEYYNVKLIEKKHKTMELTRAGNILYKHALEVDKISKLAKNLITNEASTIKRYDVGATLTIGGYVLPPIIGNYKMNNKNIDIILQVENTETIIQKLFSGEIILGVIEGPFDKNKVIYEKFKDDELVFAVSRKHQLAKRRSITIEEVLMEKLILRERGSGTRKVFEDYIAEQGYDPKKIIPYMEIGDITAIISLVESGLGATVVSREALKSSVISRKIKILPIKNLTIKREFNFIYLKNSNMEFIKNFIDFCKKECSKAELGKEML